VNPERLTEIIFEAEGLVVNVVVPGVVAVHELQRVQWQRETAVIVHCLCGTESEEESALPHRHAGNGFSQSGTEGIEQEPFEWVIVERSVCIRNVETVVDRMNVSVEEFIDVKQAM